MSGNIMGLYSMCEDGEGVRVGRMVMGLKWFDMHVIVFVTSRAFK